MRRFWAAFAALLIAAAAQAAPSFPALTGRVVDDAHVLSAPTQATLSDQLAAEESRSGNQVVVVTVPSLQGQAIEDYGVALGRAWGIGRKGKNNGVLLIVAPKEHKVRIEVGYGLEGTLTDAQSSRIIQGTMLPAFRAGHLESGIVAGVQQILGVLGGDAAAAAQPAPTPVSAHATGGSVGIFGILIVLFLFSQFLLFGFYLIGRILGAVLAMLGFPGLRDWVKSRGSRLIPADRMLLLWLLTPSHRIGGYRGDSGGGFSGGGGSFGGGGSSGSW